MKINMGLRDLLCKRYLLVWVAFVIFAAVSCVTGFCMKGLISSLFCGVTLLVAMGIIVLAFYRIMRKTFVNLVVFIGFFGIGCWVYYKEDWGPFMGAFQALAEFFPSRGDYADTQISDYSWFKQIFFLASYLFAASFIMAVFGRKLINSWWLLLAGFNNSRKSVFWCIEPTAAEKLLAKDIIKEDPLRQCIFSVRESMISDPAALLDNMNAAGYMVCFRKGGASYKSCLNAPEHFFLTDDHDWNIRKAQSVWMELQKKKRSGKVDFYIAVSDTGNTFWTNAWADMVHKDDLNDSGKNNTKVEIHFVNKEFLAARMLVKDHPMLLAPGVSINTDTCKVRGNMNVLLIGFGFCGKALLRETVCDSQFLHEDQEDVFSVTVVDADRKSFSRYAVEHSEAVCDYNIQFLQMDVQSGDFYEMLEKDFSKWNRIIIAMDSDAVNMDTAAMIINLSRIKGVPLVEEDGKRHRLFVRFSGKTPDASAPEVLDQCVFFGEMDKCYTRNIIVDEELDKRAKAVNVIYCDSAAGPQWMELDMPTRESNRSAASGVRNLLLLAGVSVDEFPAANWAEFIAVNNRKETLAVDEHLRWNAFQLMRGIRKWPLEEMTTEAMAENSYRANACQRRRRHAAVTDFDKLPAVAVRLGMPENTLQDYDRKTIANIAKIFGGQNGF